VNVVIVFRYSSVAVKKFNVKQGLKIHRESRNTHTDVSIAQRGRPRGSSRGSVSCCFPFLTLKLRNRRLASVLQCGAAQIPVHPDNVFLDIRAAKEEKHLYTASCHGRQSDG